MDSLNWADFAIVGLLSLSILISIMRGFVREALSLAVWILSFWVALTFSSGFSSLFGEHIKEVSVRIGIAFVILFVLTLAVGGVINFLIGRLIDKTGLSGTDRLLGIIFGAARGMLFVTIFLLMARLTPMPHDPWWKESRLIPKFNSLEIWLHVMLPESVAKHIDFKEFPGEKKEVAPNTSGGGN